MPVLYSFYGRVPTSVSPPLTTVTWTPLESPPFPVPSVHLLPCLSFIPFKLHHHYRYGCPALSPFFSVILPPSIPSLLSLPPLCLYMFKGDHQVCVWVCYPDPSSYVFSSCCLTWPVGPERGLICPLLCDGILVCICVCWPVIVTCGAPVKDILLTFRKFNIGFIP